MVISKKSKVGTSADFVSTFAIDFISYNWAEKD